MARRSKRKGGRDVSTPSLAVAAPPFPSTLLRVQSALSLLEDLRFWHPDPYIGPARASVRSAARVVPSRRHRVTGYLTPGLQFHNPERVAVCVRRYARRSTLFARGVAGGSVRKFRPRRKARFSSISCRRS